MAEIKLEQALEKFAGDLAKKLETFVADISELEVRTYTTTEDQIETLIAQGAAVDQEATGKAKLRACTTVAFDGDVTVWVPLESEGVVDEALWELHQGVVRQAVTNRALMIESIGEAASSALKAMGVKSG